jgi:hypothetical protein
VRPTETDPKKAMDVAVTAAGLNIAGMSLDTVFWQSRFHMLPPWHLISVMVSIVLLVYLAGQRTRPPQVWISSAAFVLNNAFIATALWFVDSMAAPLPRQSATFQPQKLGALAVAILAPPSAQAGIVSILIFVGSPIVRYELFDAATKAKLSSEPWAMVAYGIFGMGLYFYRVQSRRVRDAMHRAFTEATSLERLSCVLLAFRDFYNTPLQTLELTIAIFKVRHPEERALVARMERATDRLAELNRIASSYEPSVCGIHRVSLDAAEVLQRRGRPVS